MLELREDEKHAMLASLTLQLGGENTITDKIPPHILTKVKPTVWEIEIPTRAKNVSPITISLKQSVQ